MKSKQIIIEQLVKTINQLPEEKAVVITDFAEFILKRYEANHLQGICKLSATNAFSFLS